MQETCFGRGPLKHRVQESKRMQIREKGGAQKVLVQRTVREI